MWKKIFDKQIKVTYTKEDKQSNIYFEDTLGVSTLCLVPDERIEKLISYIDKFEEWKKKAAAERSSWRREIGTVKVEKTFFRIEDNLHSGYPAEFSTSFFTQPNRTYQFVMNFGSIQADDNQFMTHKDLNDRYMSSAQAKKLKDSLTSAAIEKAVAKYDTDKKVADEFK